VGRYARELVRALVRLETPPALRLFDVGPGPRTLPAAALGLPEAGDVRRLRLPLPRRLLAAAPWLFDAPRLLGGCDLFHRVFCDHPPVRGVPQVLALAGVPRPRSAAGELLRARTAGRHAIGDVVVTSRHARDLLREDFDLASDRVHQVRVGCDHWNRERVARPPAPGPPVLLALGATDGRRRHAALVSAFGRLRARGIEARLEFCGRRGNAAGEVAAAISGSPWREEIVWDQAPREAEMPERMARTAVLVHLSDDEHTPVTPLEAFAAGAAVVASALPAFGEALGDEATLVPAGTDPDGLADALAAALEDARDPGGRGRRRALAGEFTWDACARETQSVWRRVLARER